MSKAGNNFSGWRFIFKVQNYCGKIYPVLSICSTSETVFILKMCPTVHKEFHFTKLTHFRNCLYFSFNGWYNAMVISRASALAPASFLFLFSSSSQRLVETTSVRQQSAFRCIQRRACLHFQCNSFVWHISHHGTSGSHFLVKEKM